MICNAKSFRTKVIAYLRFLKFVGQTVRESRGGVLRAGTGKHKAVIEKLAVENTLGLYDKYMIRFVFIDEKNAWKEKENCTKKCILFQKDKLGQTLLN